MTPLLLVGLWAIGMLVAIWAIFSSVGLNYMVMMFPEGRRWWLRPAQFASLAFFAALVHFHPFTFSIAITP